MTRLIDVPLELLDDGTNVRTPSKRTNSLDYGLIATMKQDGVLQPITVVARGERYEVLRAYLDANPRISQGALATRMGRPQSWVNRHLALLLLDEATQERVAAGSMGVNSAVRNHRPESKLGRPRILQADGEAGRSRSVVVPLGAGVHTGMKGSGGKATIGLELGEGTVDILLEDGTGHGVMLTLDVASALLLGRRLRQAGDAAAAALVPQAASA